jgi:hypothetical protein
MNEAIKKALDGLEAWANDHSLYTNAELERALYPAYVPYQPGMTTDVNRHFLTHARADYNYLTHRQLNLPGKFRIVLLVDAYPHHNELTCFCRATGMPPMLLATISYANGIPEMLRPNVVDLIWRARQVLHQWCQLLYAPYAISDLQLAGYERPEVATPGAVAHVRPPRKRIPSTPIS